MKRTISKLVLLSVIVLYFTSCSKDDEPLIISSENEPFTEEISEVNSLIDEMKIEMISEIKKNEGNYLLSSKTSIRKSVDVITGEAISRIKTIYTEVNKDLNKGDHLTRRETIARMRRAMPDIRAALRLTLSEMNTKLRQEGMPYFRRVGILIDKLSDIIDYTNDFRPDNYVNILDNTQVKDEYPLLVASVRYRGQYDDIGNLYLSMEGLVRPFDYGGPFIALYYDQNFEIGHDIEICVPVSEYFNEMTFEHNGDVFTVEPRVLMPGNYVSLLHKGSTVDLWMAWFDIEDWAIDEGINFTVPARELYWYEDHVVLDNIVTELQLVVVD